MKINKITLHHVQLPMKFNFKTAKAELKLRDTIIIVVENTDGLSGYGECVSFTSPFYTAETFDKSWKMLSQTYLPELLKTPIVHPFDIHQRFENPLPMAIAGLENALLDLYYKEKGQNTIRALFDEPLEAYISRGAVIGDLPIEQMLAEIEQLVQSGVQRVKLKVNPADGYERTKIATETYPNLQFAVDANRSFNLEDLLLFENLDLVCIEEPLSKLDDYALLDFGLPICFDESVQTFHQLEQLVQLKGKKMLNIKIGRLGGLYQSKQAIDFCRKNNIGFWIGSMVESGISKILHIQLAALTDNMMAGDLSDSVHYFDEDLINPEISFLNGKMKVPESIGLGVKINE